MVQKQILNQRNAVCVLEIEGEHC